MYFVWPGILVSLLVWKCWFRVRDAALRFLIGSLQDIHVAACCHLGFSWTVPTITPSAFIMSCDSDFESRTTCDICSWLESPICNEINFNAEVCIASNTDRSVLRLLWASHHNSEMNSEWIPKVDVLMSTWSISPLHCASCINFHIRNEFPFQPTSAGRQEGIYAHPQRTHAGKEKCFPDSTLRHLSDPQPQNDPKWPNGGGAGEKANIRTKTLFHLRRPSRLRRSFRLHFKIWSIHPIILLGKS